MLTAHLERLEAALGGGSQGCAAATYVAGTPSLSIADIALVAAVQPLLSYVMGADARAPFPHIVRWVTEDVGQQPAVAKVMGACVRTCVMHDAPLCVTRAAACCPPLFLCFFCEHARAVAHSLMHMERACGCCCLQRRRGGACTPGGACACKGVRAAPSMYGSAWVGP